MGKIKYSKQREAIKNFLLNTTSHPTATTVYEELRKEYPNISLGTVYRNLNFLYEQGEILKISCDDGSDHFDGNINPHYHFMCRKCKCVLDIKVPGFKDIETLTAEDFKGKIEGHVTYFYGICDKCMNHET